MTGALEPHPRPSTPLSGSGMVLAALHSYLCRFDLNCLQNSPWKPTRTFPTLCFQCLLHQISSKILSMLQLLLASKPDHQFDDSFCDFCNCYFTSKLVNEGKSSRSLNALAG